jgi:hypothetical protein
MPKCLIFEHLLKHIDHLFAAVVGVADELSSGRVDHEIQEFQRNLADQHRAFVRNLGQRDRRLRLYGRKTPGASSRAKL